MKLSKLFLISLAACTLASCSKDDDVLSGPSEVDAYLSIAASTGVMSKSYTKTTDPGIGKEAVVNSLTAYVFDAKEKCVATKHVAIEGEGTENEDYTANNSNNKSITSIKGIHVKVAKPTTTGGASSSSFTVVLLANLDKFSVADLTELKSKSIPDITTYSDVNAKNKAVGKSFLPMHSRELKIQNLKPSVFDGNGKETKHVLNWYHSDTANPETEVIDVDSNGNEVHIGSPKGTPVELTRSVSRVQLTSLNASFPSQFEKYNFSVDSIYLANVRSTSTVMGTEKEDAAFYRGGPEKFTVMQFLIDPSENGVKKGLVKKYTSCLLFGDYSAYNQNSEKFDTYVNVNSPESVTGIPFMTTENGYQKQDAPGAYQTRLIIVGHFEDEGEILGIKHFHIPLKMDNSVGNVACNKFFQITATITGEGNPNADEILENTCINFQIKILPWIVVYQNEEDVN